MTYRVRYERHAHDLPNPRGWIRGSVVECHCGAVFTGGNPGNPDYASWRRIGWFGVGWRRVIGRI